MGLFIPILGMGLNVLQVPLHKMMLFSVLFQGEVAVGVRPALPINGVTMILGNDIAGSRVWADGAPPAIVAPVPLVSIKPDKSETEYPDGFTACAVTRAMKCGQAEDMSSADIEEASPQHGVTCLKESVLPGGEVKNHARGYSFQKNIRMGNWIPQWEHFAGEPLYQVGGHSRFRGEKEEEKDKSAELFSVGKK